jgi:5-formyltetrahydrofolate cyclo-ligase
VSGGEARFDEQLARRVKAELRKRMRGLRKTLPASAALERSTRIVRALEDLTCVRDARSVALFWPITDRHEVDLRDLDRALRARGARVAYPSIDPDTREMCFRFIDDLALLEERGLGFSEPPYDAPAAARGEIDVVVAPCLALDPRGHRLGYGAGYYDRTLPAYAPPAITIAVAYQFQLLMEIPTSSTDVAVDWVVTDAEARPASR